jgi:hypothetical protein
MGAKPRTTSPSTGERNPVHPAVARKDAITANATTGYTRTVSLLRRRDDTVSGWCDEEKGLPESAYSASQNSANFGLETTLGVVANPGFATTIRRETGRAASATKVSS